MSVLVRNLIGLLAKQATIGGQGAVETILDQMVMIPEEAITPDVSQVWAAMRTLAEQGERPTMLAIQGMVVGHDAAYWQTFAPRHPDASYLQREIVREVQVRRLRTLMEDASKSLDDPTANLDILRSRIMDEMERPMAGGVNAKHSSQVDPIARLEDVRAGRVKVIKTPWEYLNRAMGGGMYVGGESAMTAVLAYTGVGKSGWAKQLADFVMRQGHHVLYLAGESTEAVVMRDIMRYRAIIPKAHVVEPTPQTITKMQAAKQEIDKGHLYIHDRDFDLDTLRSMMAQQATAMRRCKEEGVTPSNACLLVIVDNLDHVIAPGQQDEWKAIESAARGLYRTALRLGDVHVVALCQAKDRSFLMGRAPGLEDFARSKLIASHCSNVVSLYRPTSRSMQFNMKGEEMPHMVQPKVGLPKTRDGSGDEFDVTIDPAHGRWE